MKKLNIFFCENAFYLKQNIEYYKKFRNESITKKLFENNSGSQLFEYIDFFTIGNNSNVALELPEMINKFGVVSVQYFTHTPFEHQYAVAENQLFIPNEIEILSENRFILKFKNYTSNTLTSESRYYTKINEPFISEIQYTIDSSYNNLEEKITFSDGKITYNKFHLISKSRLREPDFYFRFSV